MLADWLYSHSAWMVGTVVVGGTVALSCLGLLLFHRLVNHGLRRDHNEMVAATIAVVGTVSALLLAFIGVATWQTFSDGDGLAEAEAGAIANLYFDSYGLPADGIRESLRQHLESYLTIVVNDEWPAQQRGRMDRAAGAEGLHELLAIDAELVSFNPATPGQTNVHAEMFRVVNQLFTARRNRIEAARGHVPQVVWKIILLGTAGTIFYSYFFGARSLAMHLAITSVVAASLALVVLLIVLMDYPFRGEVSVSPDAYQNVQATIALQVEREQNR
jgi:hypothetical protein